MGKPCSADGHLLYYRSAFRQGQRGVDAAGSPWGDERGIKGVEVVVFGAACLGWFFAPAVCKLFVSCGTSLHETDR